MTGPELKNFCTSLNGDAPIDDTLLETLLNVGKAIFEGERDWMILRKTNTTLSASSSGTWQTAISLSTITDFLRFYGDYPIRLFDGNNRIEHYRQVPFSKRLEYKDVSNTFCYDVKNKRIYLNGVVAFSGTLYINYISNSGAIELTESGDYETVGTFPFPAIYHPVLGFYAIGVHKGAIDYDDITKSMLPSNQGALIALKNAMETWDTKLQLSEVEQTDPSIDESSSFRSNAININ